MAVFRATFRAFFLLTPLAALPWACSSSSSSDRDVCTPGEGQPCIALSGCDGIKLCGSDGKLGPCECRDGGMGDGGEGSGGSNSGGKGGSSAGSKAGGDGNGGSAGEAGSDAEGGDGSGGTGGSAGAFGSSGNGGSGGGGAPLGAACGAGSQCASGNCVGERCCANASCPANNTCASGSCACLPDYRDCDNNTNNGCEINIVGNNSNCGGCGILCEGDRYECCSTSCLDMCDPGACAQCHGCSDGGGCFGNQCGNSCP